MFTWIRACATTLTPMLPILVVVVGVLALLGTPWQALIAVTIPTLAAYPAGVFIGAAAMFSLVVSYDKEQRNAKR